jgi:hypothetical protein
MKATWYKPKKLKEDKRLRVNAKFMIFVIKFVDFYH